MAAYKDAKGDVRTEAQRLHPDFTTATVDGATVTENGTVDRTDPSQDAFYIGPDERREYGIPDNMEPVWIRDDRWWQSKVPGNRALEFKRENKGGQLVIVDGAPVVCGTDLVLAMRPKALVEEYKRREAAELADYERRMSAAQDSEIMDDTDFDKKNRERMMQMKRQNSARFENSGMIGPSSPSQGQGFEDYIRNRGLSEEQIQEEELSYARGRHTSISIDDLKQIAAEMDGRNNGRRGGGSKNTSYSLPPNVRPRNLAKS